MKGGELHSEALASMCQDLANHGWRILYPDERMPTRIAVKDGLVYGVVPVAYRLSSNSKQNKWKARKPVSTIQRHYKALDGIHPAKYRAGQESPLESMRKTINQLEADGWRVIYKGRKCPDALAVKDGQVWAVEVLTTNRPTPGLMEYTIRAKQAAYGMFDGCHVQVVHQQP